LTSRPSATPRSGSWSYSVDPARVYAGLATAARALSEAQVTLHEAARRRWGGGESERCREEAEHLAVVERAVRDVMADLLRAEGRSLAGVVTPDA
jgi:hypothetical protein